MSMFPVTPDDLDYCARTLYGECRGEPLEGQQAVAWVIRNRADWQPAKWWGNTVKSVCLKPKQFSCWNPNDPNFGRLHALPSTDQDYLHLWFVARTVMDGEVDDPTNGATHYVAVGTAPDWTKDISPDVVIGKHAFYRIGPGN